MKKHSGYTSRHVDLLARWNKAYQALVDLTDQICRVRELGGCCEHTEAKKVLSAAVRIHKLGEKVSTHIAKECDLQKVKGQFVYEELQKRVIDEIK
jgi:hypothetical protein